MYCPACGFRLSEVTSYCNRCGADLVAWKPSGELERANQTMDTLVWVIVGTTITLLGMALGALVIMKDGGIDPRFWRPLRSSVLSRVRDGRNGSSFAPSATK